MVRFGLPLRRDFFACADDDSETAHSASEAPPAIPVLQIKADQVTAKVSPMLYGLMTEEINFSYEGGLYGELIRNRTFKANPTNAIFWSAVGGAAISLDTNQPLNSALNVSLKLDTGKASKNSPRNRQRRLLGNSRPAEHDVSRVVLCEGKKFFRPADGFSSKARTAKRFLPARKFQKFPENGRNMKSR